VLDTGFTGHVCIARRHRQKLALSRIGMIDSELADGSRVEQTAYLGSVSFDGQRRSVLVTLTDSEDSLIGTALLRKKRVAIDFVSGDVIVVGSRRSR
jgi:predicted aspartyl protease